MSTKVASLLACLMALANGAVAYALTPLPLDAPLPNTLPGLVSRRIQIDLAKRLNVPQQSITINSATAHIWNDQCMELARPNERCAGGTMQGWAVEVESQQQQWVYRSDRIAHRLRLEPLLQMTEQDGNLIPSEFSASVSDTLLTAVSQQVDIPIEDLQISEVQIANWNGCLGIHTPETVCAQAIIPGFRVLVSNASKEMTTRSPQDSWPHARAFDQEWVYHLNADATQIVQNTAASDMHGRVSTSFRNSRYDTVELAPDVVFQVELSGITEYIMTLLESGEVTFERNSEFPEERVEREIFRQVSVEEVEAFRALLQQQQFSNFDQLSYGNEDLTIAVDGSLTLSTPAESVSMSASTEDLPAQLSEIFSGWMRISQGVEIDT